MFQIAAGTASEPTYEELKARLAELEAKKAPKPISFKVGDKGGLSMYGLGRFPVTLYYGQWLRLLDAADQIRKALEANKASLKMKDGE
jgi:hypothetical protein